MRHNSSGLVLLLVSFVASGAEDIVAPELHHDPFINPLEAIEPAEKKIVNQIVVKGDEGLRKGFLWKPELRGVIRSLDVAIANIDGTMVSLGERYEGYRLVNVKERTVVFEKNGKYFPISLDSFDDKAVSQDNK